MKNIPHAENLNFLVEVSNANHIICNGVLVSKYLVLPWAYYEEYGKHTLCV